MTTLSIVLQDIADTPVQCQIRFKPLSAPFASAGVIVIGSSKTFSTDVSGLATIALEPGNYQVTIELPGLQSFGITVPSNGGPYSLAALITSGIDPLSTFTYVPTDTEIAWTGHMASIDDKIPDLGAANTAGSVPVNIATDQAPIPVSVSSIALPTGAATNAGITGTGGKTLTDVVTALSTGSAVSVTNFPATQPVSGTVGISGTVPVSAASLPLPTGAATNAGITGAGSKTLTDINNTLGSPLQAGGSVVLGAGSSVIGHVIVDSLPSDNPGQKTMANSDSVCIASDQSAIPVSASSLPLPAGAATGAKQDTSNTALATLATNSPALGIAAKAASIPVNIASDQIVPTTLSSAPTLTTVQPMIIAPPTNNLLSATGTVQAQIEPGGVYSFCASIHSATLGASANTIASCTTVVGSKSITTATSITNLQLGQLVAGVGITPGSYITSINNGTGFGISLPATAAGTVTLNTTAGYFVATMQSSPDGTNWTTVSTAIPKTFAAQAALTGTATAPGLFTYQASMTDNYLRWNLTSIGVTGVAGNLTGNPTLRFNIDATDRTGGIINLPYCSYVAATASTFPTGIPVIMPVDTSLLSELSLDLSVFAGTSQTITWKQSNDDTGTIFQGVTAETTQAAGPISTSNNSAANYRIAPPAKYIYGNMTGGTAVTSMTIGGYIARVGVHPAVQAVCVASSFNSVAGSSPNNSSPQGSTNKSQGVIVSGVSNSTLTTTAYAGNGATNGATQAVADGGGVSASFDISVTTCTLGTASSVIFVIQDSFDNGTTWNDIWVCQPITTTGHIRVPAVPLHGRFRLRAWSIGGTSTTVTVATNVMEIGAETLIQRQFCDVYAATNPFNSMHNGVSVASGLISTTLSSTSAIANVEGCKNITISGVFTGGTPTTAPVYTLQVSQDGTNWFTTATTISPTAAGTFAANYSGGAYRFARLIVTTASSGGTPYGVTYTAINGTN